MSKPTAVQHLALHEELLTSVQLICAGLGQLQHIDGAKDFYHLPFLTLSSGFERLMKVIICLRMLEVTESYPRASDFSKGRTGHNLELLLNRILEECFTREYLDRIPVGREDIEYLQSAALLRFVKILSRFGQTARYHNLDIVLGARPSTDSPQQEWGKLELQILKDHGDWMKTLSVKPASNEVYGLIAREIVVRLERFARALARLFTIGGLGGEAKRYTGVIGTFLFLRDDELGRRQYPLTGFVSGKWDAR